MLTNKNYFGIIIVVLFLSGCIVASPKVADKREAFGEIHTEVDYELFQLLDINEESTITEAPKFYEYTITLSDDTYQRVMNGDLILTAAFKGGCKCDTKGKSLLLYELTSRVNRISSDQEVRFSYSAEFFENYMVFKKNHRYFFNKN